MKFATIFPNFEHVHLTKDVGMIPAAFSSKTSSTSYVIYWDRTGKYIEHNYGSNFVIVPILSKTKFSFYYKAIRFIISNGINRIHLFHLKRETYITSTILKLLNRKVYLKMDMDSTRFPNFVKLLNNRWGFKSSLLRLFLRSPVVISTENKKFFEELQKNNDIKDRLIYFPNSILSSTLNVTPTEWELRENRILVVGRLGDYQKNNELLLEALKCFVSTNGWTITLVGSSTTKFLDELEKTYAINPGLRKSVEYVGTLPREELFEYYRNSKILLFTSRWEGMSLAMVEASYMGMALLTTNVDAVGEITGDGKYGKIYDIEDKAQLVQSLSSIFSTSNFLDEVYSDRLNYIRSSFTLDNNIISLVDRLK